MYSPSILNVEEDNSLSPGLQSPTTGSVWKIPLFQSDSVIVFSIPEIILLFSTKQSIRVYNIIEKFDQEKQLLPSYEVNIILSTLEMLPSEKQPLSMFTSYAGYNCITFSQQQSPKKNFFNLLNNGIILYIVMFTNVRINRRDNHKLDNLEIQATI